MRGMGASSGSGSGKGDQLAGSAPGDAFSVTVRPMTLADVEAALAMFAAVASEGLWLGAEAGFDIEQRRDRWIAGFEVPARLSLVAVTDDGVVVGNAGLDVTGYGVAEIGMAVAASWRGRGVGGQLLAELVGSARALGAHKVALQVWPHNVRALALYRSHGFVVEGRLVRHYRRASGELWDSVIMGLTLDNTSPGSPHGDRPRLS